MVVNSWETESFSVKRPRAGGRGQFAVTPDFAWNSQPVVLWADICYSAE